MENLIPIEVAYATTAHQECLTLTVPLGTTIHQAIKLSGILDLFPELDIRDLVVGIFSQRQQLSDVVKAGDRIELHRPLVCDPKIAREKRGGTCR